MNWHCTAIVPAAVPTERARITVCTELSYSATKSSIYLPSPTAPSGFVLFFVSTFLKLVLGMISVLQRWMCAQALTDELCMFSTGRRWSERHRFSSDHHESRSICCWARIQPQVLNSVRRGEKKRTVHVSGFLSAPVLFFTSGKLDGFHRGKVRCHPRFKDFCWVWSITAAFH